MNSDQQLEKLIKQARQDELPFGEARDYGFETRLREGLRTNAQTTAISGFEKFGSVCWKFGWVGFSALAILVALSVVSVDSVAIPSLMTSCIDYLRPF